MRIAGRDSTPVRAAGLACLILLAGGGIAGAQVDRSLKILYAGRPGSDREKDFVAFLRQNFDTVQTGNLEAFKETDTQGFDVTLLDWDWNDIQCPTPTISETFTRPVITLGVPGGLIGRRWRLKTGYM